MKTAPQSGAFYFYRPQLKLAWYVFLQSNISPK